LQGTILGNQLVDAGVRAGGEERGDVEIARGEADADFGSGIGKVFLADDLEIRQIDLVGVVGEAVAASRLVGEGSGVGDGRRDKRGTWERFTNNLHMESNARSHEDPSIS
jgi:hypothetical protein